MKTLESTLRFMRTWCKSRDIELISSDKVVVPHAVYDRVHNRKIIYMPLLTSLNFDEWQRVGYHEAAHLAPNNIWHYDVMDILGKSKGHMLQDISNCLVDNLAERVDFYEYRGRAQVLSSARAALMPKLGDIMRDDKQNPIHSLRSALLKWDMLNRERWMINFVAPPAHETMPHLEYFYSRMVDIQLDYIIDRVQTSDNIEANTNELVELCLEIDSWIQVPSQKQNQQGQGGGQQNESDPQDSTSQAGEDPQGEESQTAGGEEGDQEAGETGEAGDEAASQGSSDDAGEEEGAGDSSETGEGSEPGSEGASEQSGDASDLGDGTEHGSEGTGEMPGDASNPGRNFIPVDEGAGIVDVQYTQEEMDAMSNYTEDIDRGIEQDVKNSAREAKAEMYQRGQGRPYIPCNSQKRVPIDGVSYNPHKRDVILRHLSNSTLDKQVRKHLQLRSTGRTVHGLKRGRLSGKNLHRLYNGGSSQVQPAVFKQHMHGKVKMDSAVSLLIDCSGSMGSGADAKKYTLAAASALAFAEVLNGLRIKHEVLGFSHSPGTNTVYLFKQFTDKPLTSVKLAERMSSHKIHYDHNADGEALQYTAERLIQMKERNKVLMVMSDGQPNGYWIGDGKHYLRAVVDDIENHSPIHLCAIGIHSSAVRNYYTNWQVVDDISQLAEAVLTTLKTNLLV